MLFSPAIVFVAVMTIAAIVAVVKYIRADKCPDCGHALGRTYISYWNRAWNAYCNQAAGATGAWCEHCQDVKYEEPDFDKWLATQPEWVVPYGQPDHPRLLKWEAVNGQVFLRQR
jgi:hypothetical protein